jgi:hypothetical protein
MPPSVPADPDLYSVRDQFRFFLRAVRHRLWLETRSFESCLFKSCQSAVDVDAVL